MSAEEIFEAKTALENVQCDLSTNTEICHLGEKFSSPSNIFHLFLDYRLHSTIENYLSLCFIFLLTSISFLVSAIFLSFIIFFIVIDFPSSKL